MKHFSKIINRFLAVTFLATALFSPTQAFRPKQEKSPPPDRGRETGEALLCTAKIIYLNIRSEYMNGEALERELLKRPEFHRFGMAITRNKENAELIIEVTRKKFTTRFTLSIIDPDTNLVIASDSANSVGGTIEPKLADRFVKQLKKSCSQNQDRER